MCAAPAAAPVGRINVSAAPTAPRGFSSFPACALPALFSKRCGQRDNWHSRQDQRDKNQHLSQLKNYPGAAEYEASCPCSDLCPSRMRPVRGTLRGGGDGPRDPLWPQNPELPHEPSLVRLFVHVLRKVLLVVEGMSSKMI